MPTQTKSAPYSPSSDRRVKIDASLESLAEFVGEARARGLRVAHCHGIFDVLHPGLVKTLEEVRAQADCLVVTIVDDSAFANSIEPAAFNQRLRSESVAALGAVDRVTVALSPNECGDGETTLTAAEVVEVLSPDVFSPAPDLRRVEPAGADETRIREIGVDLASCVSSDSESPHALNSLFGVLRPETEQFLDTFRERYSASDIAEQLHALSTLKVLVLGDVIIDEYHYCRAVGKSSKSATLTAKYLSEERHAGGVLAVANHLANFAGDVQLLTLSGRPVADEAFIRGHLKESVRPELLRDLDRHTVVKRRFVDPFRVTKMFEVMWVDGDEPSEEMEDELLRRLPELVDAVDLVLVCDFGHGSVGRRTIEWLSTHAPFLAINTQTNSANFGYNLVTKYPRADYVCIDEQELQLAHGTRSVEVEELLDATARGLGSCVGTVTLGSRGSLTWSAESSAVRTPVLATNVIDSVGAGDAYLSVTALCARAGLDPEVIGFVGNCVGALAVHIVGNRESVEKDALLRYVDSIL